MMEHLYQIAVRPEGQDQYVAHVVGLPELKAEGMTEDEAVEKARLSLVEFLAKSKITKVKTPGKNPWLEAFGSAADDPDFEEYLEDIRQARLADEG